MSKKVIIDFSEIDKLTNKCYTKYYEDYRRYQIYKGGAGAGKSVYIAQSRIYNVVINKGFNGLVVRQTGRDNHDSTFAELRKAISQFGLGDLFNINFSRGAEEITCKVNKNKIIFRGLDDVEKLKSVTFDTGDLVWVWWEEAPEGSEESFNQLDLRLRGEGKIPKHIILSFNPIDIDSWIKKRFFDFPLSSNDGYIIETTYKDNEFLDNKYREILEGYKEKDYYYYCIYVLNQWGARTTARVFHNLVIEDFDIPERDFQNRRFGQDYGFNHANALLGVGYKDGELYLWKEFYAKNQLNSEFITVVDNSGLPKDYVIYADSAEPDKIAEWNKAGYIVYPVAKGPGSLLAGVNYLKELPRIHIHKTRCPNAAREFPRFKYRELRDGKILDEVVEIDDDTIAAVRYATEDFHAKSAQNHYFIKRRHVYD